MRHISGFTLLYFTLQWNNLFHGRETCWIRMNQDESAMKQFVSWSWNTVKHVEFGWNMVMKHLESGWSSVSWSWNTLNRDKIVIKHTVSCQWNTLNQGRWPQRYLFSYIDFWVMVFHCAVSCSIIDVSFLFHCCFMLFHCYFMLFHCWFIAVSCCFIAVSLLFHCCFKVFRCSVSFCFTVFQGVSLSFFILFHDHETGAVGTSLNTVLATIQNVKNDRYSIG